MGYRIRYELRRRGRGYWWIVIGGAAALLLVRRVDYGALANYVGECIRACGG